jgi:hypothetical protein
MLSAGATMISWRDQSIFSTLNPKTLGFVSHEPGIICLGEDCGWCEREGLIVYSIVNKVASFSTMCTELLAHF